jgi:hypothetical protein
MLIFILCVRVPVPSFTSLNAVLSLPCVLTCIVFRLHFRNGTDLEEQGSDTYHTSAAGFCHTLGGSVALFINAGDIKTLGFINSNSFYNRIRSKFLKKTPF